MKKMLVLLVALSMCSAFAEEKKIKEVVLTSDNALLLNEVVDAESMGRLANEAAKMDSKLKSNEPIYLVMYTPGGSIQDGLEGINLLKGLNRPIHTITIFAASMGFQIVQNLGDRYVTPFGTLMAHKAKGGFQGEFPGQIDSRYVYYIKRLNEMDRITAARTGGKLDVKQLQALYENEHWVEGQDAVNEGLADAVVQARCDASLNGAQTKNFNLTGFSIVVSLSKCPLNQGVLSIEAQIHTNQGIMPIDEFLKKGGKLGKQTSSTTEYDRFNTNWSVPMSNPPTAAAPVPNSEEVTLEKINQEIETVKKRFTRNKSIVVKE